MLARHVYKLPFPWGCPCGCVVARAVDLAAYFDHGNGD